MKNHPRLLPYRSLLRLLSAVLLAFGLTVGGACSSPPVGSPFVPIPPPDPTFGPPTSELDSTGASRIYWKISSPPSTQLRSIWVYVDNSNLGLGVSLRASEDGSYTTRIEGQEGDRILFGFGAAFADAELRLCRPLREGLASSSCQ
jgi:hypothetical protein